VPRITTPRTWKVCTSRSFLKSNRCAVILDICEDTLPINGKAWETIAKEYNLWAQEQGRAQRPADGLKTKYNILCVGAATDQGGFSERQLRARKIEKRCLEATSGAHLAEHAEEGAEDSDEPPETEQLLQESEGLHTDRMSPSLRSHPAAHSEGGQEGRSEATRRWLA
jgi:hypothetical protein